MAHVRAAAAPTAAAGGACSQGAAGACGSALCGHRRSGRGDGTVPAASAELPGTRCVYAARVAHSDLTREPRVAAAVADLLLRGTTARLPARWRSASRARAQVSDHDLQRTQVEKVDWGALAPTERRVYLQELNEPPRLRLRVPGTPERARRGVRRKRR